MEGLLRGDTDSRREFYAAMRQWGIFTVNDVLELENMEQVEGGDTRLLPAGYSEIGQDGKILNQAVSGVSGGSNGKDRETEKVIKKMLKKQSQSQTEMEV
jgi:hypothetical protein